MSKCPTCGGVDSWHHDLTDCLTRLKAQLAERERRISNLEREHDHLQTQYKIVARREEEMEDRVRVAELESQSAKRDLAAALRTVAGLESAARRVVNADTFITRGVNRLEGIQRALVDLEALLPEPAALCAASLPQSPQNSDNGGRNSKDGDGES
jgi:chromosome segregation ATPase